MVDLKKMGSQLDGSTIWFKYILSVGSEISVLREDASPSWKPKRLASSPNCVCYTLAL